MKKLEDPRPPPGNTSTQILDTLVDPTDMGGNSVCWGKITVNGISRRIRLHDWETLRLSNALPSVHQ